MYDTVKDLPDDKPPFPLPVKWVGIENIEYCGHFKPHFQGDPDPVHMACNISLYCSLSKDQRGVHVSRFPEILIRESDSSPKSILQFCRDIAEGIRKSQRQECSRVKLLCKHTIKRKSPVAQRPTLIPLLLGADVIVSPKGCTNEASLEFEIITMCPCVLEMAKSEVTRNYLTEKSSPSSTRSFDSLFTPFSHTQRARLKLSVTTESEIEYSELLKVAEEVSCLVSTTLKRPDEFRIVQDALNNPAFCEDMVRHALVAMKRHFKGSYPKVPLLKLTAMIDSHESIHPFSLVAYGEIET